jgi:hypothetical protein
METQHSINDRARRIEHALEAAFGVKSHGLAQALRKTGRRLPKRLHAEAHRIIKAQAVGGHPKLMHQVDSSALSKAEARLLKHLKGVDRADQRKGRWLSIAAVIVFNLLLVFGAFVIWMVWSGKL